MKANTKSEKSFQYEWDFYNLDKKQQDYYKKYTFEFLGEKPQYFKNKKVLEIGCGMGRMTNALAPYTKEYIAIDLTNAINKIPKRKNLIKIKADFLELSPDKYKADFVFSRGVLHHCPNPKKAFEKSLLFVKNNGIMVFAVYRKRSIVFNIINFLIRFVTTKIPHHLLYSICKLFSPLVPVAYLLMNKKITRPLTKDENTWLLFDWFSPQYQYHISEEELDNWVKGTKVLKKRKGYRKIKKI